MELIETIGNTKLIDLTRLIKNAPLLDDLECTQSPLWEIKEGVSIFAKCEQWAPPHRKY